MGRKHLVTHSRSLTGVSGDAGSATQSFTYDGANRVIAASGLTNSAAYLYDHDSNRVAAAIGASSTGYTYDRAGQLVSRVDGGSPHLVQLQGLPYGSRSISARYRARPVTSSIRAR